MSDCMVRGIQDLGTCSQQGAADLLYLWTYQDIWHCSLCGLKPPVAWAQVPGALSIVLMARSSTCQSQGSWPPSAAAAADASLCSPCACAFFFFFAQDTHFCLHACHADLRITAARHSSSARHDLLQCVSGYLLWTSICFGSSIHKLCCLDPGQAFLYITLRTIQ